ncbi:MAG: metalloregulator ArsR/SmtB family transcription factor [Pseudomonadota bacterium]
MNPALDRTFTALADPTRRAILWRLREGEAALSAIAVPFDMSQTAVSKHVRVLSDAGLVEVSKRGRTRFCRLLPEPMKDAANWLGAYQSFWQGALGALAQHLEDEQ